MRKANVCSTCNGSGEVGHDWGGTCPDAWHTKYMDDGRLIKTVLRERDAIEKAKYKGIPIRLAKEISKEFNKDQVIIIAWDARHSKTHVTTYGKTITDCEQAAQGGNLLKKAMGWPDALCNSKPARSRRKKHVG